MKTTHSVEYLKKRAALEQSVEVLINAGFSYKEIARLTGKCVITISNVGKLLCKESTHSYTYRAKKFAELFKSGNSIEEIAEIYNLAPSYIEDAIATQGVDLEATTPRSKRKALLIQMFNGNFTLEEMGNVVGITRERVRQLLEKWGYNTKLRNQKASKEKYEQIRDAVLDLRDSNPSITNKQLIEQLGITADELNKTRNKFGLHKWVSSFMPAESILKKIASKTKEEDGHLFWTAGMTSTGHPIIQYMGRPQVVMRLKWSLEKQESLEDFVLIRRRELCDNPSCLNLEHVKKIPKDKQGMYLSTTGKAKCVYEDEDF